MKMFSVHVNMGAVVSKAVQNIDKYDAEKQKKIRKVIADGTKNAKSRALQMTPKGPTGNLKKASRITLSVMGEKGLFCLPLHMHICLNTGQGTVSHTPSRKKP